MWRRLNCSCGLVRKRPNFEAALWLAPVEVHVCAIRLEHVEQVVIGEAGEDTGREVAQRLFGALQTIVHRDPGLPFAPPDPEHESE